jgi:hypothetical protein
MRDSDYPTVVLDDGGSRETPTAELASTPNTSTISTIIKTDYNQGGEASDHVQRNDDGKDDDEDIDIIGDITTTYRASMA